MTKNLTVFLADCFSLLHSHRECLKHTSWLKCPTSKLGALTSWKFFEPPQLSLDISEALPGPFNHWLPNLPRKSLAGGAGFILKNELYSFQKLLPKNYNTQKAIRNYFSTDSKISAPCGISTWLVASD
jgi:hypothetical protein